MTRDVLGPLEGARLADEPGHVLPALQAHRPDRERGRHLPGCNIGTTILMVTHDVEEAVYLSGPVYVLTSHPGRVAAEVPVPLPADRGPAVKRDPLFLDLHDQVQEILVDQVRV